MLYMKINSKKNIPTLYEKKSVTFSASLPRPKRLSKNKKISMKYLISQRTYRERPNLCP